MIKIPFKKSPIEFNQRMLFPSNIFDILSDDHESYVFSDIFQQLDTTSIESKYKVEGQNAYHPKLIVSILIYSYSRGIFSSRKIQRRCNEDLSFMYIAQMNCPNFRVLSDFRKDNIDFFHSCFKQTVKLAIQLGLASLCHVSLDGSKFKANSSKHKAMSYKHLKHQEKQLSDEINSLIKKANLCDEQEDKTYKEKTGYEMPEDLKFKQDRLNKIQAAKQALEKREQELNPNKEIDDKKQISFSDHDARIMGKKGGDFDYKYNAQINTDSDNQIIVGQHVSQKANDTQEVEPALDSIKQAAEKLPEKLSADNGYMSGENLQKLEDSKIDCYIAINKGEKKPKESLEENNRSLVKADFKYDEKNDEFICPGKQILTLVKENKDGSKRYKTDIEKCNKCEYKNRCSKSKKGDSRTISTDANEPLRRKMNDKMELKESKVIYKERKVIVEPVFGQIKNNGFRGFGLRGIEKVKGEFSLVCATHNIKKIVKNIVGGLVRQKFEKLIIKSN